MRMSMALIPTLREVPSEALIPSHQLLLKAGFIRKTAAGMYNYLPLGKRVLDKIERIVREEMDKYGGQEILMPITQPAELWEESGRWDVYGEELIRFTDRHNRSFCLGPTHEEVVTDLVRKEVTSYKSLPLRLYQIQNKYRDERRPRFGLMRGREFIMKDLYSFDLDEAGLDQSYQDMYQAYSNIFTRCGLAFRPVVADSGQIGGGYTHEFMVLAETGEATIAYSTESDYAANIEIAPCNKPTGLSKEEEGTLEKVYTPDSKTILEVAKFLKVETTKCIKTLVYMADNQPIVVLTLGTHEANDVKIQKVHPCNDLRMATEEEIKEIFKASPGSLGPVGLDTVPVYADWQLEDRLNLVCGANEDEYHYVNVCLNRDAKVTCYADLRMIEEGEPSPDGEGVIALTKGIEVGQVFKLGTKYSEALGAVILDENGKSQPIVMGCYGIGVSRTMAAAVEQNYDEKGIIWPMALAPYHVVIVIVNTKDALQVEKAESLYRDLQGANVEVILDDRKERAGVKFNDADLIGFPIRITVGKGIVDGQVELKLRNQADHEVLSFEEAYGKVLDLVKL